MNDKYDNTAWRPQEGRRAAKEATQVKNDWGECSSFQRRFEYFLLLLGRREEKRKRREIPWTGPRTGPFLVFTSVCR